MPTRLSIAESIAQHGAPHDFVRRRHLRALHKYTGRVTIVYASAAGMQTAPGALAGDLSINSDDIRSFMDVLAGVSGDGLDLILHSPGGQLDAAEGIVGYLRRKFTSVRAIVPQYAMSAATMIACACDEIVLGKHSCIGPTDPQISLRRHGKPEAQVSAQVILDEVNYAFRQVQANPATAPLLHARLDEIPPGFLVYCQQTIERGKDVVTDWLTNHMKLQRDDARRISEWLGSSQTHRSHGRPITIIEAEANGLKVKALEDDPKLQDLVLSVFHSTMLTFENSRCGKLVENHAGRGRFILARQ